MIGYSKPAGRDRGPAGVGRPAGAHSAREAEEDLVYRMADKMRTVALNGRSVDADVLGEEFTQAEIDAHWRDARDLARTLAVRKVA